MSDNLKITRRLTIHCGGGVGFGCVMMCHNFYKQTSRMRTTGTMVRTRARHTEKQMRDLSNIINMHLFAKPLSPRSPSFAISLCQLIVKRLQTMAGYGVAVILRFASLSSFLRQFIPYICSYHETYIHYVFKPNSKMEQPNYVYKCVRVLERNTLS